MILSPSSSPLTKSKLVNQYKKEKDPKVKERLLLVIRVRCDNQIPYRVVKEMNRSNPWALDWLKRYDEEGITGLKDRTKSGRKPELPEGIEYEIKTILRENNHGWTTKQIEELILRESGIKYHYAHIYRIVKKWGFKQKVPRKIHVNTASAEEKDEFKNGQTDTCGYPQQTERLCYSILRRIILLLRFTGKKILDG
jgi:putative transposase